MPSQPISIDESKLPKDSSWRQKLERATTQPDREKPITGIRWYADLQGEDGNAWVIMGVVRNAIRATFGEGWQKEADRMGKAARSGDYQNLLRVARSYIEIVDRPTGNLEFIEENDD